MDEAWPLGSDLPPALALRRLILGHRVTQVIATAAQLGLADYLADTPKSAAALAPLVHAEGRALYRFLRALASIGVVVEGEDHSFALTPLGACLRTDAPSGMRAWALFEGAEYYQRAWGSLRYAVQTGAPAAAQVLGMDIHAYLRQHPDAERRYSEAMVDLARLTADAVVDAYAFAPGHQVVDVGGGYGIVLAAILQRHPALQGVLFDLPAVMAQAGPYLQTAGVADRCDLVSGDYFEAVPTGGDVYILSRVLMAYEDDRSVRLLRNCHRAMAAQGRVLIIQQVLPPPGRAASRDLLFEGTMSDLNMLVLLGGHDRTEAEYGALLEAAGFTVTQVIPTRSLMSIVEGTRA
jgi:SAM-dependent methyltransferase